MKLIFTFFYTQKVAAQKTRKRVWNWRNIDKQWYYFSDFQISLPKARGFQNSVNIERHKMVKPFNISYIMHHYIYLFKCFMTKKIFAKGSNGKKV